VLRGGDARSLVQDDEFCQTIAEMFEAILIRVDIDKPKKAET
jgi:hypothetical protein